MKKFILVLFLLLSSNIKTKASENNNYLITSSSLPYYFVITQNDHLNMYCFPKALSTNHLDYYQLNINHYVELNLTNFKTEQELTDAKSCRKYLGNIIKQLSYQDLFKLKDYINSSLTLTDYLNLFPLIKNPPKVNYYYGNYLILNDEYFPLDYQLE